MPTSVKAPELQDPALAGKRLYLFSSNVQPLYASNILDIVAAPAGHVTTLRYGAEWLNHEAERHWASMRGLPVLIHFSLQHTSEYFNPAFFPVRYGWVVSATLEAGYRFVEVALAEDVSLRWTPEAVPAVVRDSQHFLPGLDDYRDFLDTHQIVRPYRGSATLHDDVVSQASQVLDSSLGAVEHFRRNAEFLARTESFRHACFVRFLRLVDLATREEIGAAAVREGRPAFQIQGGGLYELEFFSYQPGGVETPATFTILVGDDTSVRIVGEAAFDVASPYDRPRVTLQAGRPGAGQTLTTPLSLEPPPEIMGPRVRLLLEVRPAARDKALNLAGPFLALAPIAAATLVTSTLWKVVLATIGVGVAVTLQWFGISAAAFMGPTTSAIRPATSSPAASAPGTPTSSASER